MKRRQSSLLPNFCENGYLASPFRPRRDTIFLPRAAVFVYARNISGVACAGGLVRINYGYIVVPVVNAMLYLPSAASTRHVLSHTTDVCWSVVLMQCFI